MFRLPPERQYEWRNAPGRRRSSAGGCPQEVRHRIDTPSLRGVNIQRLFGSQRALKTVEDFTEFEQRAAYFDGDPVIATKKGVNVLDRGSTIHDMAADQPVERASTLKDIRAEVLTPDRLNAIVFGGFAGVALLISVVGVAGVLAFSVSGRTREFGIRIALGAMPRNILTNVLSEGLAIAGIGVAAGLVVAFALARAIGKYVAEVQLPGALIFVASAAVILAAAVIASAVPAARAARVDAVEALRSE